MATLAMTYLDRRRWVAEYFNRTAAAAWAQLTSDAPVSRIRQTVREGRDRMRAQMLAWLPGDLAGARVLDAGCGTGALSIELARRGASVVAVDVAPAMVELARHRADGTATIDFRIGDMLDPVLGQFDIVVAMDSLIHYDLPDALRVLASLGERTGHQMIMTFAPQTTALMMMHAAGRLFPRGNRAPAIRPVGERALRTATAEIGWPVQRTARVSHGFYTSQAYELVRRT